MNQGNTLMNFRISVQLKKELEIICKSKNIKLTYVLLYLIKQFVNKEDNRLVIKSMTYKKKV
jgi:hypothetical protein